MPSTKSQGWGGDMELLCRVMSIRPPLKAAKGFHTVSITTSLYKDRQPCYYWLQASFMAQRLENLLGSLLHTSHYLDFGSVSRTAMHA